MQGFSRHSYWTWTWLENDGGQCSPFLLSVWIIIYTMRCCLLAASTESRGNLWWVSAKGGYATQICHQAAPCQMRVKKCGHHRLTAKKKRGLINFSHLSNFFNTFPRVMDYKFVKLSDLRVATVVFHSVVRRESESTIWSSSTSLVSLAKPLL